MTERDFVIATVMTAAFLLLIILTPFTGYRPRVMEWLLAATLYFGTVVLFVLVLP